MKQCFVGFDTSNYTTSCAVCDIDGKIIANLKAPLPVSDGQRGLRQSDAVFAHIKNLPQLMEQLSNILKEYSPAAVGVSTAPRDAMNSYMPCFLAGKSAAYAFAAGRGLTVHESSHQNGHIMAALYSADKLSLLEADKQFSAFHVSGGTTEALLITPHNGEFTVELVGNTADINAGQAIDRVGVLMGLKFPCGAALEELAKEFDGKVHKHRVCVNDCICSLSGVENISDKLYTQTNDRAAVAVFVFDFICNTLTEMCTQLTNKYGNMPIVFAGGVMSNSIMRRSLSEKFEAYFSEPEFSADNAAGVALICRNRELRK